MICQEPCDLSRTTAEVGSPSPSIATVLGALEKVKGASAYDSKVIAFFDKMIVKQMQFPNNRAIKKLLNKGSLKVLKKMISSKRNNAKDTLDV